MKIVYAEALRASMEKLGLNQAQLAAFLGVDPVYVGRWLRGREPRFSEGLRILKLLGWDFSNARPGTSKLADVLSRAQSGRERTTGSIAVAEASPQYGANRSVTRGSNLDAMRESLTADAIGAMSAKDGTIRFGLKSGQLPPDAILMLAGARTTGFDVRLVHIGGEMLRPAYESGDWLYVDPAPLPKAGEEEQDFLLPVEDSASEFRLHRLLPAAAKPSERLVVDLVKRAGVVVAASKLPFPRFRVVGRLTLNQQSRK